MTVLPFIDIQSTPIHSVESPRKSKSLTILPPINASTESSSKVRTSIPSHRSSTPKIKIVARSDEILKRLPHEKTASIIAHNKIWKPFVRELPDYDYLWEPLKREDVRHQYDFYHSPSRIIPNLPDEPYRMTTMFETQDRHYHNYKRTKNMKQRQWNKEHIQYTIYPYAEMIERDLYNKQIRSTLKEQMEEKCKMDKHVQDMKHLESQFVIEQDRQDLEKQKQKEIQRANLLLKVTTKNKELMENKRAFDRWNRVHEWHVERTVLADDPINWSKTLT